MTIGALAQLYSLYEDAAKRSDGEFAFGKNLYREHTAPNGKKGLQCGRGCSSCCAQLFDISLLEGAAISRHVKTLPEEQRERLRARAREYRPRRKQMEAQRAADSAPQGLVQLGGSIGARMDPTGLRLACPALENDECTIYAARPLICRKFGMPVYTPSSSKLGACELNFSDGEAIENTRELVRRQRELHELWESAIYQVEAATGMSMQPLTVADALLGDYDAILEGWVSA